MCCNCVVVLSTYSNCFVIILLILHGSTIKVCLCLILYHCTTNNGYTHGIIKYVIIPNSTSVLTWINGYHNFHALKHALRLALLEKAD